MNLKFVSIFVAVVALVAAPAHAAVTYGKVANLQATSNTWSSATLSASTPDPTSSDNWERVQEYSTISATFTVTAQVGTANIDLLACFSESDSATNSEARCQTLISSWEPSAHSFRQEIIASGTYFRFVMVLNSGTSVTASLDTMFQVESLATMAYGWSTSSNLPVPLQVNSNGQLITTSSSSSNLGHATDSVTIHGDQDAEFAQETNGEIKASLYADQDGTLTAVGMDTGDNGILTHVANEPAVQLKDGSGNAIGSTGGNLHTTNTDMTFDATSGGSLRTNIQGTQGEAALHKQGLSVTNWEPVLDVQFDLSERDDMFTQTELGGSIAHNTATGSGSARGMLTLASQNDNDEARILGRRVLTGAQDGFLSVEFVARFEASCSTNYRQLVGVASADPTISGGNWGADVIAVGCTGADLNGAEEGGDTFGLIIGKVGETADGSSWHGTLANTPTIGAFVRYRIIYPVSGVGVVTAYFYDDGWKLLVQVDDQSDTYTSPMTRHSGLKLYAECSSQNAGATDVTTLYVSSFGVTVDTRITANGRPNAVTHSASGQDVDTSSGTPELLCIEHQATANSLPVARPLKLKSATVTAQGATSDTNLINIEVFITDTCSGTFNDASSSFTTSVRYATDPNGATHGVENNIAAESLLSGSRTFFDLEGIEAQPGEFVCIRATSPDTVKTINFGSSFSWYDGY